MSLQGVSFLTPTPRAGDGADAPGLCWGRWLSLSLRGTPDRLSLTLDAVGDREVTRPHKCIVGAQEHFGAGTLQHSVTSHSK